jgi:hypothetical protein
MVFGGAVYLFKIVSDRRVSPRIFLKNLGANVFFILSLVLLSFLPNLLAPGYAAFYRCSLALTPMIFLIFLWALLQLITLFPRAVRRHVVMLFLAGLMGYGVFQAYDNILQYRIIPSQNELAYIKKQLRRQDLYQFQRVHLIRPDPKMYEAFRRYDEFGVPTTAYQQGIPGILKCALREIGLEPFFGIFIHVLPRARLIIFQ